MDGASPGAGAQHTPPWSSKSSRRATTPCIWHVPRCATHHNFQRWCHFAEAHKSAAQRPADTTRTHRGEHHSPTPVLLLHNPLPSARRYHQDTPLRASLANAGALPPQSAAQRPADTTRRHRCEHHSPTPVFFLHNPPPGGPPIPPENTAASITRQRRALPPHPAAAAASASGAPWARDVRRRHRAAQPRATLRPSSRSPSQRSPCYCCSQLYPDITDWLPAAVSRPYSLAQERCCAASAITAVVGWVTSLLHLVA